MNVQEILDQILGKLEAGRTIFITYDNRSLAAKGNLQISEAAAVSEGVSGHGASLLRQPTEIIEVPDSSRLLWGSLTLLPSEGKIECAGRMRQQRGLVGRNEFDCRVGLREIHDCAAEATTLYALVWSLFDFAAEQTNRSAS